MSARRPYSSAVSRFTDVLLVFATLWSLGSGWQNHGGHSQSQSENRRSPSSSADDGVRVRWPGSAASSEARFTQQHIVHPRIDRSRSSEGNVSVLVGKQVLLRCVIDDLGNESVSWIRHDTSAFLAVNNFVYASSGRFKVFHEVIRRPSSRGYGNDLGRRRVSSVEEWRLSVNPVELEDSGLYECQVSTTPHISHFMRLTVIEPLTSIVGTKELFIESGSTINLTCVIHTGGQSMGGKHIFWNYNGKIITHDRNRVGTIVINRRTHDIVTSLIITRAQTSDSGTYACDPTSPFSKSIRVVVTTGGDVAMRPNAIVRSAAAENRLELTSLILTLICGRSIFRSLSHEEGG